MSDQAARLSSVGYLVDLWVQLQRDGDRADAELHRRDRELARKHRWATDAQRTVLRRWLEALQDQGEMMPGRWVARLFGLSRLGLAGLGALAGVATASALLAYDGSRPVNVVPVFMVLVVLQVALLVLLGGVLLPGRWVRWLPGAEAVQGFLAALSPGQLVRLAGYAMPGELRGWLARARRGTGSGSAVMTAVLKWAVVLSAQLFGVMFNLGALAACLYLVAFSDLAFGWSTTLQPDPERMAGWTKLLSWPWAWLAPGAVPSESLIRETLFYRQAGVTGELSPEEWGQWWPFLAAGMITYGLIPRAGLWLLAQWRFHYWVGRAFLELPGVVTVWDRLTSEWVTTQATAPEAGTGPMGTEGREAGLAVLAAPARRLLAVDWGGVGWSEREVRERLRAGWGSEIVGLRQAGGRTTLEADAAIGREVSTGPDDSSVVVLVKGWEPPVLELLDFLAELRVALGPRRLLVVCPAGLGREGRPTVPGAAELQGWEERLRSRGDPGLVVRGWPGEETR